ncbi:MAG: tyrosine-protein phosphatase [bacterium]
MYDLHCHMLPAIDDGAKDLQTALQMARMAADDGITHLACTPHIYPGLFENTVSGIKSALADFQKHLEDAQIPLQLSYGADIQVGPELVSGLRSGTLPSVNETRYFLFEPPHHIPLKSFRPMVFDAVAAGYVPIITHPERLSWIEDYYDDFLAVAEVGGWMQLTCGSVTGRFGKRPKYWAERMLDDGIVYLLATDAHNLSSRPPLMAESEVAAAKWVGDEEASLLVRGRTAAIWNDVDPSKIPRPPGYGDDGKLLPKKKKGLFNRLFG